MTGSEFRRIRQSFGMKKDEFMYALGYGGNSNTMHLNCHRYEKGEREIPLYLAQYVWLLHELAKGSAPPVMSPLTGMPEWPEWPQYYADEDKVP